MEPIQTQILGLIAERLANITMDNEYSTTVEKIERAKVSPFKNSDLPAINYYYANDKLSKVLQLATEERTIPFVIEFYTVTRDRIFIDVASELACDVKIAIERDMSAPKVSDAVSPLLGKKIMKLEFDAITPAIGEGQKPYCGVVLLINITYKVNKHDPFTIIT